MGKVLSILYRTIFTHLTHKAGCRRQDGIADVGRLTQHFGSALSFNIPFHILFLDRVYRYRYDPQPRFPRVKNPDKSALEDLAQLIS